MKTQTQSIKTTSRNKWNLNVLLKKKEVLKYEALSKIGGAMSIGAKALTAAASAVMGANNYFLQQGLDRFNLAQELRQSIWSQV